MLGKSEKGDTLDCPDCKVLNQAANGINSFPKNLVLLSVKSAAQPNPPSGPGSGKKKEKPSPVKAVSSPAKVERPKEAKVVTQPCSTHGKKLEAFCEKDKCVLCIDCILSDKHKNHEIVSVQKAVDKQKLMLVEEMT